MKKQDLNDHYSNWNRIMSIQCSHCLLTKQKINITSYGDWGMGLYQRDANKVDRPIIEIMKEKEMDRYWGEQGKTLKVENHSNLTNVKQALEKINILVKMSEEEFKNRYGFWEISDFAVYNRDGNSCSFSFRTKDKFYYGSYGTS